MTPQRPTQDTGKLHAGQAPPVCRLAGAQAEEGTACSLVAAAPPSTRRRAAGSVWEATRTRDPAGGVGAQLRGREALRSVARNSCPSEGTEPGPQDHSAVSNMDSAFKNPHPHFKKTVLTWLPQPQDRSSILPSPGPRSLCPTPPVGRRAGHPILDSSQESSCSTPDLRSRAGREGGCGQAQSVVSASVPALSVEPRDHRWGHPIWVSPGLGLGMR